MKYCHQLPPIGGNLLNHLRPIGSNSLYQLSPIGGNWISRLFLIIFFIVSKNIQKTLKLVNIIYEIFLTKKYLVIVILKEKKINDLFFLPLMWKFEKRAWIKKKEIEQISKFGPKDFSKRWFAVKIRRNRRKNLKIINELKIKQKKLKN